MQTHQNAVRDMTVERYLLDELAPLERDEFESHAFGCTECAADLRAAAAFIGTVRRVLGRDVANAVPIQGRHSHRARPPGWLRRLEGWMRGTWVAPLLAACVGLVVLQGALLWPQRRGGAVQGAGGQTGVVNVLSLIGANSRAGGRVATAVRDGEPLVLVLDIPGGGGPYRASLRDPTGMPFAEFPVSVAEARDTVTIYIPPRAWPSGEYVLVVDSTGTPPHVVTSYPFRVDDSKKSRN